MPLVRHICAAAALFCWATLAACSSPALPASPAGGMSDSTSSVAPTPVPSGVGPGFLTPTPPAGGGGVPVTPPPGGIAATTTTSSAIVTAARSSASPVATASANASPAASPTATYLTPTPEATDTPVPVSRGGVTSIQVAMPGLAAVKPNGVATVQATASVPGAICTLTVRYRTGGSPIPQFAALTADANGAVSWSWQVAPDVVTGDWPVTVRCQVGLPLDDANLPFAYATNLLPIHS